jgi:hypothetical protein
MHYTEIAEAIVEQGLRANVGATPARTVSATITNPLKDELEKSPFVRVGTGYYSLKESAQAAPQVLPIEPEGDAENTGLINAFGMYWTRDNVLWTSRPRILGQQQLGSTSVDFCEQSGVYLLHDGRTVV